MSTKQSRTAVLAWPALLLVALGFIVPVAIILVMSVTDPEPGTQNFEWLATNSTAHDILWRTIYIAVLATLITAVLAYPFAYLMATSSTLVRSILMVVVLLPFWTSMMVRAFAWIIILQKNGLLNTVVGAFGIDPLTILGTNTAVLIGMCQILMPFMVLPMVSVMVGIDSRLPLAARIMGAPKWKAFLQVYFPLSLPGVFAGSLIVFILSLGFYVTPALLGSPRQQLIPNALFTQVLELLSWGRGGALAVATLVMVGAVFLLLFLLAKVMGIKIGKIGGGL
ncbi:ABC transporter permease [Brevibacterium sp. UCMA 11752]|uniref:ABC transporter permease n=1 Tax=Brevibacterium sp. UCMA 11752 TaxID=2745946 RepID=UPI001F3CF810|nr:ABC transporter permease [Brevibacterium sp. UCMA 11752]MCF2588690.1 ABC transporter permease [Brevibacterium sp. UCMA 11752]